MQRYSYDRLLCQINIGNRRVIQRGLAINFLIPVTALLIGLRSPYFFILAFVLIGFFINRGRDYTNYLISRIFGLYF